MDKKDEKEINEIIQALMEIECKTPKQATAVTNAVNMLHDLVGHIDSIMNELELIGDEENARKGSKRKQI